MWEAWAAIGTIVLMVVTLVRGQAGPDTALIGGLFAMMTLGLFADEGMFPTVAELLRGYGNEGVVTIAVLLVVAEGLRRTGAMNVLAEPLLGRPRSVRQAQARLMFPVAGLSAFLNNTPIVAMFIPVVREWCKRTGISPSKLYIPLSYAAIMGGTCTLIGTSTNVFVDGMVLEAQRQGMLLDTRIGMFTISLIGIPVTLLGIGYLLLASKTLLPDRRSTSVDMADARRYTLEMMVEHGSTIDGKSIESAGLRRLSGAYLVEIDRDAERLVAVGPEQILRGGDRLIFAGLVDSVVDLQRTRGLIPATDQVFKLSDPRPNRQLVEAVVSGTSPLSGKSIREGRFRTVYDAAVIAVHRNGEHMTDRKIGDIVLRAGDTLLIEANPRFSTAYRNSPDFCLVSPVADSTPVRHDRAGLALGIMVVMVVLAATETTRLVHAALGAAGLLILTRCCTPSEARGAINWRVLLAMGSALGIGKALETTGAATMIADGLLDLCTPVGSWGLLAGIYLTAMIFNSLIGPIGSAAIVFPVAKSAMDMADIGSDFTPFAITIMIAASASFATPISYQTNLMVYGAGGYRFSDYVRIGLPLNFLLMFVTVVLSWFYWLR